MSSLQLSSWLCRPGRNICYEYTVQNAEGVFPLKGHIVAGTSPQLELCTYVSSFYSLVSVSPSDQGKLH